MSWPAINPGDLRHQIRIQVRSMQQDAFGSVVDVWTDLVSLYGGINLVSMREAFGMDQLTSQQTHIWTVRWVSQKIKPGMRLAFMDEVFEIQAVENVEKRNILIHLLCEELGATN